MKDQVEKIIDQKLSSFNNLTVPTHTHNAVDAPQIISDNILITQNGFRSDFPISFTPISIGGGQTITKVISVSSSINFAAITPNSSVDVTVTVTGALDGDSVSLGVQDVVIASGVNCGDISFFAWVSSSDNVTIRCTNSSAVNTANPATGNFRSTIIQF